MASSNVKKESPAWKNPREIFRRHLKRKSSSRRLLTEIASSPALLQSELSTQSQPAFDSPVSRNMTRFCNPFKRGSPRKRAFGKSDPVTEKENSQIPLSWDSEETLHTFASSSIFDRIDEEQGVTKRSRSSFYGDGIPDIYPTDFSAFTNLSSSSPKSALSKLEDMEKTKSATLPHDLRLGWKLRMESKKPFPWMNNPLVPGRYQVRMSGVEQDIAIRIFCGQESTSVNDVPKFFIVEDVGERSYACSNFACEELSPLVRLQAAIMYWQYPNIAWMRMFPRIDGSQKLAGASRDSQIPSIQTIGPGLAAALVEQWTQAFEQLFHSWKKGTRSSFYLCCSSFTVLFLKTPRELPTEIDDDSTCSSWRVAGDCFRVIITPTTLGFREQLRDEGISYTMRSRTSTSGRSSKESGPAFGQEVDENTNTFDRSESQPALIIPDKQSDEQKPLDFGNLTGEAEEEESPNKLDRSDDSDNVAWLKDIGMSPASTRRLTKHLSMSSMSVRSGGSSDSGRSLPGGTLLGDDGGKSTVVISEPSSIQALFNLFNTSKICRPVTGPHAGLPPTLLSAQPFLHSTLSSLNKSSQVVKKGNEEMVYICELGNGPIMPHMIASVFEFVNNCPSINNTDNNVTLHVSGRSYCQGINQAIASEGFSDWNELVYRVAERNFYY